MVPSIIIFAVCLLMLGYTVRKKALWRTAMAVMASAAFMVPLTALSAPVASASARHPVVLAAHAGPPSLPSAGGAVMAIGKVRDATTCRLAVLGDHGVKISLPKPVSCTDGQYRERLVFGPDTRRAPVVVKLGLLAGGAKGVFYVVVAPSPAHTAVLEAKANPWELPAKGGWTTVIGKVRNARTCHLLALGWKHPTLPSQNCSSGTFTEKLWLSANEKHVAKSQVFELVATGGTTATGKFFVRLAPAPVPPVVTTTTAVTSSPATSTPPVTSGITTGAPPPFFPSPPPATTTTTVAPTTTTTVAPTTTTTSPPLEPCSQLTATAGSLPCSFSNWSGYAQTNGPYTGAQGTFTVPALTTSMTCSQELSQWVGIDGYNNQDLIQAGIDETPVDPSTGQCTPGYFYIVPWWEILPATETPITQWDDGTSTMLTSGHPINMGDSITVTIIQQSGGWDIALTDNTTGETFEYAVQNGSDLSYSGPANSAEWVLEAPYDPTVCSGYCQLPPYCAISSTPGQCASGPGSTFSQLASASTEAGYALWQMYMVQGGVIVSEPSALSGGSFSLTYTGTQQSFARSGLITLAKLRRAPGLTRRIYSLKP